MGNSVLDKRILLFVFILCLFSIINSVYAKVIYVAPTGKPYSGNANNTSYNDPIGFNYFSNQIPSSVLSAGDTLYFKGGQYNLKVAFKLTLSNNGGNTEKMTFVGSYPGEVAVFDFRNQPYGKEETGSDNIGLRVDGNYTHLKGIVARYSGKNGFFINATDCLIESCTTYGNCDSGFQIKQAGNLVKNCDSFENFDYKNMSGSSPKYGNGADGFADTKKISRSGTLNTYIGCRSWRNSDDGWDFYGVQGESVIRNCWAFDMAPEFFDMTDHPRYEKDKTYFDTFEKNNGRIILLNYGNGNGFKLGGGTTYSEALPYNGEWAVNNVILTNCVAFGNGNDSDRSSGKGFDQNNNHGKMTIYNCTAYGNKRNYGFTYNTSVDSLIIRNSISTKGKISDSFSPSKKLITNNNWNLGITVTDADFVSVDTEQAYGQRNTDGNLSDMGNLFYLTAGSNCIDKGINVGLPYVNTAPDLGAFEFNSTLSINKDKISDFSEFVYPNPIINEANFSIYLPVSSRIVIELFDMMGKRVAVIADKQMNEGSNNVVFHKGGLSEGVYLYTISYNGKRHGRHLIIK